VSKSRIRTAALSLPVAMLIAGAGLAGTSGAAGAAAVGGAGALDLITYLLIVSKGQPVAVKDQEAAVQRELRLKRIERLKRTGRLRDADRLMPLLKDPDGAVREHAEQAIWSVWGRSGNAGIDQLFRAGVGQMGRNEIEQAIDTFTRVIDHLPGFAEAWNKRATARFLAGDLAGAMDDCERALTLVPDHFGSLAGYGHIYFRLDDLDMAILYWRRALAVNPNLLSVARSIEAAEKILAGRGRLRT
jgi:tetratricopeptide (TPR) repeat protein